MMQIAVVLALCCVAAGAVPSFESYLGYGGYGASENCSEDACRIADNCRCSSAASPLSSDQVIPQFVSLTFDEALNDDLYNDYWRPLLFNRTNPDGQRIGATFFVPHEYTNYQRVNDLYKLGFEIGVQSITNNPLQNYWRGATQELLEQEFGGQKRILSKFANIPTEEIVGVRTPQLQLAGDLSIQAYINSGLNYDSSWPTLHTRPLFPYTLDYLSTQQCNLGTACPTESFKGFWVQPIVDLVGDDTECNNLASCRVSGTTDEIADWLVGEVERVRTSSRVPLTLIVTSNWFTATDYSFEGLNKALDTLATYDDVFLVSQKEILDWIKNPVPASEYKSGDHDREADCSPVRCSLKLNNETTVRYMISCVNCPAVYPWLGNPDGDDY